MSRPFFDRGFVRGLGVAVAAGGVLAFVGAFGSDEAPVGTRLLYWIPLMLAGGLWGHACSRLIHRWIDEEGRPWLSIGLLTAVITGPLAVVVWAYSGFLFQGGALNLEALPFYLAPVGVITLTLATINVFLMRARPTETHAAAPGEAPSRFLERLPFKLKGAAIRAVEAEDHYLRVHTDRGSDLILMRLSDAVTELEGLEGAQVHRSWWVARDAVTGARRGDGRATLEVEGGLTVPVSRRYARALREAGWF